MRIGVYAIALNEEPNVAGWADAIDNKADHVLIADTGSTDQTRDLAHARGIAVHEIALRPFRFDDAWNAALALMPADIEVCVAISLDVRLPPGWRATLESEWHASGPTMLRPWFDVDGLTWRWPFVHSRHGLRYRFPFHELLLPVVGDAHHIDSSMTFTHVGDGSRQTDIERNLALLRTAIAENPHDLRQQHYYGRELMYAGRWNEAIAILAGHAASDAWAPDRSESWIYVGDCMVESMPIIEVPDGPYRMATRVSPDRRETWVKLATLYRKQSRWSECLAAATHALSIVERTAHFNHGWAWGPEAADCAALASLFLGRYANAVAFGETALALEPDNERLVRNLEDYRAQADVMVST